MIIVAGAFLWLVSLAVVYRLCLIGPGTPRGRIIEITLLGLLAVLVFFRPHEDIFGGEDPGSYINSGLTYNRQKQLFYVDELLAKVPPDIRPFFYYGHAGYGATKDACLWVRNADLAMVGPHFQPAYPLLIALAAKIGHESWALFVVPLFAIFTALALRALALLTIPWRWAGLIVFLLYIFNPLTIWHGRCARPEIISAFMFFGGFALVLHAWQHQRWQKTFDLILGALCIGLAPLFHVTAWLLVIPAGLMALVIILRGRDDFLLYGLMAILTAGLFYAETKHITDYYTLLRFFGPIFSHPLLLAAAFIVLAASALLARHFYFRGEPPLAPTSSSTPLVFSLLLGAGLIIFLALLIFARQIFGNLPVLGQPVKHYLYLTDFRVVANMLSVPMLILVLAGAIAWLTGPQENRKYRVSAFIVILPAVLLTGNIHDFMMTRYLTVAFIPLATLLLAALIIFILPQPRLWAALLLCAIICALGLNKRTHLATTVEHQGFCRFLRPYAETIKAKAAVPPSQTDNWRLAGNAVNLSANMSHVLTERSNKGILLCEYSRIAAPLEHFFGIPTLGLDNERQNNYEKAEKAWAGIMAADPERPAFFVTPYHTPLSAYFDFEEIFSNSFQDCRLEQARQGLPSKVGRSVLTLRLFRMKLKPAAQAQAAPAKTLPLVLAPDAGNLGWRNFANMRQEPFPPQEAYFSSTSLDSLSLPENMRKQAEALMGIPRSGVIPARWTRARSEVLLPSAPGVPALLMIHLRAPDPEGSGFVTLQLTFRGENFGAPRKIPSEKWQWQVWQLPPSAANAQPDLEWLGLNTEPAWNPGKPNFPADLGILVSRIVCLPIR